MSKKEFEELVKLILYKTGMTREQLSEDSGRNKGYISQILSRGEIPAKYVELLKLKYLVGGLEGEKKVEMDLGATISRIQAVSDVTLLAVAELLAKANGQSAAVVAGQLEDLVKKRLDQRESNK
ncbi:hypothetical protein [Chitinophaga sp. YIM B06452]|uniref:hypothetical protein n=1 Tax=Chitinophaga sp. YIM B06452 TaxID=3082158 RepID=UPI0031FEA7E8